MRWVNVLLIVLLAGVQVQLWLGPNGLRRVGQMEAELESREARNAAMRERNARLAAEVRDLREGLEMVEERARVELGMVRPDELMVQLRPQPAAAP